MSQKANTLSVEKAEHCMVTEMEVLFIKEKPLAVSQEAILPPRFSSYSLDYFLQIPCVPVISPIVTAYFSPWQSYCFLISTFLCDRILLFHCFIVSMFHPYKLLYTELHLYLLHEHNP